MIISEAKLIRIHLEFFKIDTYFSLLIENIFTVKSINIKS